MTQTATKTATCCNKPARTGKRADSSGTTYAVWCETCGRRGIGATEKAAADAFAKATPDAFADKPFYPPARPEDLPRFAAGRLAEFQAIAAPFVRSERSAFARMVKQNIRYVMGLKGDAWNKVWSTPEGIQSIIDALEDAFSLGATLPDMGCFVPYNGIAEFIPSVEAYEFALTTGKNAPFSWIHIEPVYKNDIVKIARVNGAFSLEFTSIQPDRGEVVSVAVYGHSVQHGHVIGEVYTVERLIEKAKQHSASYRYFLQDVAAFEQARTEGKVLKENGREYIVKKMFKKGGDSWDKKLFLDEIENPYDGPDRPEMLRKSAGKSFLAKYIRVRNSQAAIDEIRGETDGTEKGIEDVLDRALDAAFDQFPEAPDAPDAPDAPPRTGREEKPAEPSAPEPPEEPPPEPEKPTAKKDDDVLF